MIYKNNIQFLQNPPPLLPTSPIAEQTKILNILGLIKPLKYTTKYLVIIKKMSHGKGGKLS